jgi:cell division protein FtsQ
VSSTRIRRPTAPPRRPARAPKKRKTIKTSRLDAMINALPVSTQRLQQLANWTLTLALFSVVALAAHALGVTAKVQEEWAQMVGRAGFQVRKVEVVGAERIDRLKVYDIALAQKDRSMAALDLAAVRGDLMKYGWIKDARVSRRLPDTLVVDIVERTPAAIWQHSGRLSLIDEKGVVLEPVTIATMPDLPLVIGPKANTRAQDLDRLLAEASSLKELLAGATWVGDRRWDLRFRSGETLSLPEGEGEAQKALAKFAHMDGANRLLGRGILRFDMRDPDRFVLRLPHEGQVAPAKLEGARAAADALAAATAAEEG